MKLLLLTKSLALSVLVIGLAAPEVGAQTAADDPLVVHYAAEEAKTVTIQSAEVSAVLEVPSGTFLQISERGAHDASDYARFGSEPHVYRGEVVVSTLPAVQVEGVLARAFAQPASQVVLHEAEVTVETNRPAGAAAPLRVGEK